MNYGTPGLREVQICRMAEEALDQGGVLTQEDLADILQVDVRTVRRTIRQLQERSVRVQTRGLYHDIGPSISHKAWIVGLHLEYKTYSEIARTARHLYPTRGMSFWLILFLHHYMDLIRLRLYQVIT
jgi:DeoR/GlpR family transcriptional regulator of sugar metabolism